MSDGDGEFGEFGETGEAGEYGEAGYEYGEAGYEYGEAGYETGEYGQGEYGAGYGAGIGYESGGTAETGEYGQGEYGAGYGAGIGYESGSSTGEYGMGEYGAGVGAGIGYDGGSSTGEYGMGEYGAGVGAGIGYEAGGLGTGEYGMGEYGAGFGAGIGYESGGLEFGNTGEYGQGEYGAGYGYGIGGALGGMGDAYGTGSGDAFGFGSIGDFGLGTFGTGTGSSDAFGFGAGGYSGVGGAEGLSGYEGFGNALGGIALGGLANIGIADPSLQTGIADPTEEAPAPTAYGAEEGPDSETAGIANAWSGLAAAAAPTTAAPDLGPTATGRADDATLGVLAGIAAPAAAAVAAPGVTAGLGYLGTIAALSALGRDPSVSLPAIDAPKEQVTPVEIVQAPTPEPTPEPATVAPEAPTAVAQEAPAPASPEAAAIAVEAETNPGKAVADIADLADRDPTAAVEAITTVAQTAPAVAVAAITDLADRDPDTAVAAITTVAETAPAVAAAAVGQVSQTAPAVAAAAMEQAQQSVIGPEAPTGLLSTLTTPTAPPAPAAPEATRTVGDLADRDPASSRGFVDRAAPGLIAANEAETERAVAATNTTNRAPGTVVMANRGATRNRDLDPTLDQILQAAGRAASVITVVTSGGQAARGTPGAQRVGTTRHDLGRAADVQVRDADTGRTLDFSNAEDAARMGRYAQEAVRLGAQGVGAARGYMGTRTMHIGFGPAAVWGGRAAPAPFIREAFNRGIADRAPSRTQTRERTAIAQRTPSRGPLRGTVNRAGRGLEHAEPSPGFVGPGTQSASISPGISSLMTGEPDLEQRSISPPTGLLEAIARTVGNLADRDPTAPPAPPAPPLVPQAPPPPPPPPPAPPVAPAPPPAPQAPPARTAPPAPPLSLAPSKQDVDRTAKEAERAAMKEVPDSYKGFVQGPVSEVTGKAAKASAAVVAKGGSQQEADRAAREVAQKELEAKAKESGRSVSDLPGFVKDAVNKGLAAISRETAKMIASAKEKAAKAAEAIRGPVERTVGDLAERDPTAPREVTRTIGDLAERDPTGLLEAIARTVGDLAERDPTVDPFVGPQIAHAQLPGRDIEPFYGPMLGRSPGPDLYDRDPDEPFVGPQLAHAQLPGRDIEPFYGPTQPRGPDLYDRDPDVRDPEPVSPPTVEEVIEVAKALDIPVEVVMQMTPDQLAELVAMFDPGGGGILPRLAA